MQLNIDKVKKELKALTGGGSLNDVYRLLFHIALLKYSTADHLKKTHATAFKVATKPKLKKLSELGYISSKFDVLTANSRTYEILKLIKLNKRKIDLDLLPGVPEGYGGVNELNNTEVFVQALHLPDIHALLYPNFGYLRPDALMALKREKQCRLVFLEVEAGKSNWDNWLFEKRLNYLKLAKDEQVYEYWTKFGPKLGSSVPDIEKFKFTVTIVGKINNYWGDSFTFTEELCPFSG